MKDHFVGKDAWCRALCAAARLMLCLALVLLPIAGVSAAHFDSAAHAAQGHDTSSDAPAPHTQAPLCHQMGACHAFVTPAAPCLARTEAAAAPAITAMRVPASAALHRLLRPPIPRA